MDSPLNHMNLRDIRTSAMYSDVNLHNYIDRLTLEYTMLKASTRHSIFAIAFAFAVLCIGYFHSPTGPCAFRGHLRDSVGLGAVPAISTPAEMMEWLNSTLLPAIDTTYNRVNQSVISSPIVLMRPLVRLSRESVEQCTDATFITPIPRLSAEAVDDDVCISDADKLVFKSASKVCLAARPEPLEPACAEPRVSARIGDYLVIPDVNSSIHLNSTALLSSLHVQVVFYWAHISAIALMEVGISDSSGIYSIHVLRHMNDRSLYFIATIASLALSGISVILDLKNLAKKIKRKRRIPWKKMYTLINTVAIPVVTGIRWLYFESILDIRGIAKTLLNRPTSPDEIVSYASQVDDIYSLKHRSHAIQLVTVILVSAASIRLFRILSSHPRTSILSSVCSHGRAELVHFVLTVIGLVAYYTVAWSALTQRSPLAVLQSLVQVPFGVWPFDSTNTVLLICFGLISFYWLLNIFQILVNLNFRRYRGEVDGCVVANGFFEDMWLFVSLSIARVRSEYKWPHRLVVLFALESIRDQRHPNDRHRLSVQDLRAELSRITQRGTKLLDDPIPPYPDLFHVTEMHRRKLVAHHVHAKFDVDSVFDVWKWYTNHFGLTFLACKAETAKPTLQDEIVRLTTQLNDQTFPASTAVTADAGDISDLKQRIKKLRAVHPNSGNFSRVSRLSIVDRVRKLVAQKAYEKRPEWLEFVERAPPMELTNLKMRDIRIKSPYPAMVQYVLRQFPDMRFQDSFVDGNDWSVGNDRYRDDHPVMQFVARQLQLMNEGVSRQAAFERTKEEYLERRIEIESRQKLEMAMACNARIVPAFNTPQFANPLYTTGAAIARQREAQLEVAHLNHIRRKLRMLRKEIEPHNKRRMSAKEVALDIEVERNSLLPRIAPSQYKVVEPTAAPSVSSLPEDDSEEDTEEASDFGMDEKFEFELSRPGREDDEFEWVEDHTHEPSMLSREGIGRKMPPVDVSRSSFSTADFDWKGMHDVDDRSGSRPSRLIPVDGVTPDEATSKGIQLKPVLPVLKSSTAKPAFTQSRPDKQTVQAILAKKKKEELQKRIGKEPGESGEDDQLDFEDFMNMIQKQKK